MQSKRALDQIVRLDLKTGVRFVRACAYLQQWCAKKIAEYAFEEALPAKAKSSGTRKPGTHSFPFRGSRCPLQRKQTDFQLTPTFNDSDWLGRHASVHDYEFAMLRERNTADYVPDPKYMPCTRDALHTRLHPQNTCPAHAGYTTLRQLHQREGNLNHEPPPLGVRSVGVNVVFAVVSNNAPVYIISYASKRILHHA